MFDEKGDEVDEGHSRTPDFATETTSEKAPKFAEVTTASTSVTLMASPTNPELEYVRETLLRLSTDKRQAFFKGLRELIDYLNSKHTDCEDEVSFMLEDISQKMSVVKKYRNELLTLRSEICNCNEQYASKHSEFMRLLQQQKGCDLLAKLEYSSKVQQRLKQLYAIRKWLQCERQWMDAIKLHDYVALLDSLQQITKFSFEQSDTELKKQLLERRAKVLQESSEKVCERVKNLLDKIGYPLEEHRDLESLQGGLDELVLLLKAICILEANKASASSSEAVATDKTDTETNEIVSQLFEPFEVRFRFHFYGDVKTNNIRKPEWMYTQVITWIDANCELFEQIFGQIFQDSNQALKIRKQIDAKLVDLAVERTHYLAEKVVTDRALYSYLIDEAVAFENALKDVDCRSLMGRVLSVFCEEPYAGVWLEMERGSCTSGVERILMSDERWQNRFSKMADLDVHRVPECTDQFILLMESIIERYRWIPDVEMQSRFLELQVLMLDEYRLRLVQISQQLRSPWDEPFIQLLNSFWYIACILEDWNGNEAFVKVQTKGTTIRLRGVFDDMADMYRHVWRQHAIDMANAFYQFVCRQLDTYTQLNWFSMEILKPMDLTPTFCPFLLELRLLLGRISSSISPDSALTVYRMLNEKIAQALMKLINNTSFNYQGAAQMLYDITSSLIPLLNSLYSRSSTVTYEALDDHQFEEAVSALRLLSVSTANAILLRSELKKSPEEMTSTILAAYDASLLSRQRALALFEQRCDLHLDADIALHL